MASEKQFSLFGLETPEDIRRRIGRTQEEMAVGLAGIPKGRVGVAFKGLLGQGIGAALRGSTPEEEMAKAKMEAFSKSQSEDLGQFYTNLANNLKDIDPQMALSALQAKELYDRKNLSSEALAAQREASAARNMAKIQEAQSKLDLDRLNSAHKRKIETLEASIAKLEQTSKSNKREADIERDKEKLRIEKTKVKNNVLMHGADNALKSAIAEGKRDDAKAWRELQIELKKMDAQIAAGKATFRSRENGYKKMLQVFGAGGKEAYARKMISAMIDQDENLNSWKPWDGLNRAQKDTYAGMIRTEVMNDINTALINGDPDFDLYDSIEKNYQAVTGSSLPGSTSRFEVIGVE